MTTLKALIQYNCIPHYRSRIFELLSKCEDVEFTVLADTRPDTPHLKTISGKDRDIRHIVAKNHILRLPKVPAIFFQPGAVWEMFRSKPDVVIALGTPYSITAWLLALQGRIMRIPVLLWTHGLLGNETGFKWLIRKMLYSMATGTLLYGEYARDLLVERGFDPDKQFVVYNSLDYDVQQEVISSITDDDVAEFRSELGLDVDDRLIVFTGRLQPIKKLDMLVEAVALNRDMGNSVHLVFVGDGDERGNLESLAQQRDISDRVHFLGASYDERYIGTAYTAADVSVVPSGAGLSIMHSMVYGAPAIIHDNLSMHFPEWEAVVADESGFFYRFDDINDLAEVISRALYPVSCKREMEEKCRLVIKEKYNPHVQVELFEHAVTSVAESR